MLKKNIVKTGLALLAGLLINLPQAVYADDSGTALSGAQDIGIAAAGAAALGGIGFAIYNALHNNNNNNNNNNSNNIILNGPSSVELVPGVTENITILNTSANSTVNNVNFTFPESVINSIANYSGCSSISPYSACVMTITAASSALPVTSFPITVQGSNTSPINITGSIVASGGEVTASNVTFTTPGVQTLTLTNSSSATANISSVTAGSSVHNVTIDSSSCPTVPGNGGTCTVNLTAAANAYGSDVLTTSYTLSGQASTAQSSVTVTNTNMSITGDDVHGTDIILEKPDEPGPSQTHSFEVNNTGNFVLQTPTLNLSTLAGVTVGPGGDCTGPVGLGSSCTFNLVITSDAVKDSSAILHTTSANADEVDNAVIVHDDITISQVTNTDSSYNGYRAVKVQNNTSPMVPEALTITVTKTGLSNITENSSKPDGDTNTKCEASTTLDATTPFCLVWFKANTANQITSTDSGTVTVGVSGGVTDNGTFNLDYDYALYAGGTFTTASDIAVNRIAKWNGTSWSALGVGMNSDVDALTTDSNNNIYAGGGFSIAGGNSANNVAKWNGTSWSALGDGTDNQVFAVAVDLNNNVYVGGAFIKASGISVNYIAKWDGISWSALSGGTTGGGGERALMADSNGNIYVGGYFTEAGSVFANCVAKWNSTGSSWSSLGNGTDGAVYALTKDSNNNVYVGGLFGTAGSSSANHIAKWNGTNWSSLGTGIEDGVNNVVNALTADSNNNVYVGGEFDMAGGNTVNHIAKWNGTSWSGLGGGTNGSVGAIITTDSGNNIYVGGGFDMAGGNTVNHIAKWNSTDSSWSALSSGVGGTENYVYALAKAAEVWWP